MFDKIYVPNWMSLPKDIRHRLTVVFNIQRSGITEIRDQDVITDGVTNADLSVITLQKMNEYIGSDENFTRAWELTIAKAKYELNPPEIEIGVGLIEEDNNEELNDNIKETTKKKLK